MKFNLLLILAALIFLCSCSGENAIQIRFNAEKLYHNVEKLYEKASIKPDPNDIQTWSEIKKAYHEVASYCWQYVDSISTETNLTQRKELESIAYLAINRLSGIYFREEKLDSTILVLNQLLNMTDLEGLQLLSAKMQLAKTKQWQGLHEESLNIYKELIDFFYPPVDNNNKIISDVLNLPLEIVKTHRILENTEAVEQGTKSAETYYLRIIEEWPSGDLETAAHSNLARLYNDDEQYEKAIGHLQMVRDSSGQIPIEAGILIADITAMGLKKYETAANIFDSLIGITTDTLILPNLYVRKGVALFESRYYQQCLNMMNLVRRQYESYYYMNSTPQKYIALANDKLGEWVQAEMAFMQLADNYPTTEDAFNAYLYVAEHYSNDNNQALADVWYRRAEEFYDKMARNYSGTTVEASALSFKAEIARRNQNWEQAIDILVKLYDKFPNTEVGYKAIVNAAAVYRHRLNDEEKADELINRLRNRLVPGKEY